MPVIPVIDGFSGEQFAAEQLGASLVKAAGTPVPATNLVGMLYASPSGWLLLSVPAALVRGVFQAMDEPGIELPLKDGVLTPHVSVMRPEDLAKIGGIDKITERGKQFHYSLGRLMSVVPDDQPDLSKVYYCTVYSNELKALRRSYGLSGLPKDGKYEFHVTVAVRRKHVLGENQTAKLTE